MLCATRPNDYEHETIYDEANIGSRSACVDLTTAPGRALAEDLLTGADVVVNNHRGGKLEKIGLDPVQPARRHPGMVSVSVPVTGMINDFITGYMGALGAPAALRATEGGSRHVTVDLIRTAMWCQSLGLVDAAAVADSDDEHTLREPDAYDAATRSVTCTLSPHRSASPPPGPAPVDRPRPRPPRLQPPELAHPRLTPPRQGFVLLPVHEHLRRGACAEPVEQLAVAEPSC